MTLNINQVGLGVLMRLRRKVAEVMIEKILDRLEEEREISYADFYEYITKYQLDNVLDIDSDWFYEGLKRAKAIVQEVAKEYNNGWIPVTERLPEESVYNGYVEPSEFVLVFTKDNECRVSRYWGNRRNKRDYYDWLDIKYPTHDVLAWQPLPPAYKKGE